MSNRLVILNTDPLTEDGLNGIFDAQFKEEIIIEEESEIALQSTLINRQVPYLEVSENRNGILCRINKDADSIVKIPNGSFSRTTLPTLLEELQHNFNRGFTQVEEGRAGLATSVSIGKKIRMDVDNTEKINWTLTSVPLSTFEKASDSIGSANTWTFAKDGNGDRRLMFGDNTGGGDNIGGKFFSGRSAEAVEQNYAMLNFKFITGCGQFRCRINKHAVGDPAITPNGMMIGLVENTEANLEKARNNSLTLTDMVYAIRTNKDYANSLTSGIQFRSPNTVDESGGFATSTVVPTNNNQAQSTYNDHLIIDIVGGKIRLIIFKRGGTFNILDSSDYDYEANKSYLPVINVFGDPDTGRMDKVGLHIDPDHPDADIIFHNTPNLTSMDDGMGHAVLNAIGGDVGTIDPYPIRIDFPTLEVANFFGYNNLINGGIENVRSLTLLSDKAIDIILNTNTYLIELLNLSVDSFHSGEKGRKNILSAIPTPEDNNSLIRYEPSTLFYVALRNKFKLSLRNLRARVITNQFDSIKTQGISEINLLIRKGNN
mgnify:CR=1 FL=1